MYEVSSEVHFSAAHHLHNYDGPCENIHGHNWLVRAYVRCEKLNDLGIGIDFKDVRRLLSHVVESLDHKDLNTIFNTQEFNPSSENIAQYIYNELEKLLDEPHCKISRVDVYETPGNCTSYFEHD